MLKKGDIIKVYWSKFDAFQNGTSSGWKKAIVLKNKGKNLELLYPKLGNFIEMLPKKEYKKSYGKPKSGDWIFYKNTQRGGADGDRLTQSAPSAQSKYYPADVDTRAIPFSCPMNPESPNDDRKTKKEQAKRVKFTKQIQKPPQIKMIIGNLIHGNVKESLQWRRKLGDAIKSGELKIQNCNLPQWLNNFKVLGKCSASDTSVVLAHTKDPKLQRGVSLKISYPGGYDNSLEIERGFYKIYFDFIQEQFFSPNVVTFYASFTCNTNDFRKIMTKDNNLSDLYKEQQILNKNQFESADEEDRKHLEVLIIERTQGVILKNAKLTNEDWVNVLFQILYTFEVFNRLGLRHNDAHLGNIFIDSLDSSSPVSKAIYAVDKDSIFKVNLQKMVKLFDLDLSGSYCDLAYIHPNYEEVLQSINEEGLCENTKLSDDFCSAYGLCNDRNIYFDTFLTLGMITQLRNCPTFVREFIFRHIDIELLSVEFEFPFHLGSPLNRSQYFSFSPTKYMSAPAAMLQDEIFEPLKIDKNTFATACTEIPVYHLPLNIKNDGEPQDANYWHEVIPETCYEK